MKPLLANSAAVRFLRLGWPGLERWIARLTDSTATYDERVLHVLESSTVVRLLENASRTAAVAAQRSRAVAALAGSMRGLDQRSAGAAIVIAAVVHVALQMAAGDPTGNLWLMLPILFAALGTALIATNSRIKAASNQ